MRDALLLASAINNPLHKDSTECECQDCNKIEEESGCAHPNLCTKRAGSMLDTLSEKWDPRKNIDKDQPDVEEGGETPEGALKDFNPNLTTKEYIADAFRIFTSGAKCNKLYPRTQMST